MEPSLTKKQIHSMVTKDVIRELRNYDQYKNLTDYYIKKEIGGKKQATADELKSKLIQLSSKTVVKSPSKNLPQKLPNDVLYQTLLNSDVNTLRQLCLSNKHNHQICTSNQFWQNKLRHHHLPNIIFDDTRTIELMADNLELDLDNKIQLWSKLYQTMKESHQEAKNIILIYNVLKDKGFTDMGNMRIILYDIYDFSEHPEVDVDAILHIHVDLNHYLPNFIDIIYNNDQNIILKYTVLDQDTEDFETYDKNINKNELINILTLFLFDYKTITGMFDIQDVKGKSYLDQKGSDYLRGMWDLLNYQQKYL